MPLDQFAAYFFKLKQHILPFSVGNVEELRTTENAFLARFGAHFFWVIFDYKIMEILNYLAKCRRQIGLMPNKYMYV